MHHMPSNYGTISNLPGELSKHIPKGFATRDTLSGEVNGDHYRDFLIVLKEIGEDTIVGRVPVRPLLIFTGQRDGSLKLAARNDKVVYCIECGGVMGDPYEGMTTIEAAFSVHMFGEAAGNGAGKSHSCIHPNTTTVFCLAMPARHGTLLTRTI